MYRDISEIVATETGGDLVHHIQFPGNITNERFSCVPGISKSIFKPRHPVYLVAFNVCTLKQAKQKAVLALTLDSLGIEEPLVSETIRDRKGVTISNKEERLDRWAEYFEQQLSWTPAGTHLEPTESEFLVVQRVLALKCAQHQKLRWFSSKSWLYGSEASVLNTGHAVDEDDDAFDLHTLYQTGNLTLLPQLIQPLNRNPCRFIDYIPLPPIASLLIIYRCSIRVSPSATTWSTLLTSKLREVVVGRHFLMCYCAESVFSQRTEVKVTKNEDGLVRRDLDPRYVAAWRSTGEVLPNKAKEFFTACNYFVFNDGQYTIYRAQGYTEPSIVMLVELVCLWAEQAYSTISDENHVAMKCTEVVLLLKEEETAQMFLNELTKVNLSFGAHLALTKCKIGFVCVVEASYSSVHVNIGLVFILSSRDKRQPVQLWVWWIGLPRISNASYSTPHMDTGLAGKNKKNVKVCKHNTLPKKPALRSSEGHREPGDKLLEKSEELASSVRNRSTEITSNQKVEGSKLAEKGI
ncbi:hypothetical protein CLF_103004 [Clonorchis sinensis]|uniref:Uncharacterized protein n=1 Tax=Clonorchis sinensis TaxID=79923 RepID=G7Y8W0_CLOSI|nr:hypothetical protein CLF_103004 [Clonorchis sinensis]